MFEPTDDVRMELMRDVNRPQLGRQELTQKYGQVWDTREVQELFQIHGFLAPFVSATRKSDGVFGALVFQHTPRYYFGFQQE